MSKQDQLAMPIFKGALESHGRQQDNAARGGHAREQASGLQGRDGATAHGGKDSKVRGLGVLLHGVRGCTYLPQKTRLATGKAR